MSVAPIPIRGVANERVESVAVGNGHEFAPARVGDELERFRSELTSACEDLRAALPPRGVAFVDDTLRVVSKLSCRIAFIGQVKAGKSSFINAFVRRPGLLPTHVNPWTTAVTHLHFGVSDKPDNVSARYTFFDANEWERLATGNGYIRELTQRLVPGFQADLLRTHVDEMRRRSEARLGASLNSFLGHSHEFPTVDPLVMKKYVCAEATGGPAVDQEQSGIYSDIVKQADLFFSSRDFSFPTVIIDTPGTNDPFLVRDEITRRSLEAADIYVVILTARQALTSSDVALLRILRGLHKDRIAVFVNRIDELGDVARDKDEIVARVRDGLAREFQHGDIPIVAGSALWAHVAMSGSPDEIGAALNGKAATIARQLGLDPALAIASRSGSKADGGQQALQQALMKCSGFPAFCELISGLTIKSHAGHVLKQAAGSLSELAQISIATSRREQQQLEDEAKTETARFASGGEELKIINAEVTENERLTLTLHSLLVDLKARTDQLVEEHKLRIRETLRDDVDGFAEMECSELERMIAAGDRRRIWSCQTNSLRRTLEKSVVTIHREGETSIVDLEAFIFPKLRELLRHFAGDGAPAPIDPPPVPRVELPSLSALAQSLTLDMSEPWWQRWLKGRRPVAELRQDLSELIRLELYPVIDALSESSVARLQSRQSFILHRATALFLSLIEILQEQSRARQLRTRELVSEREAIQLGLPEQNRKDRVQQIVRQIEVATRVSRRVEAIDRMFGGKLA